MTSSNSNWPIGKPNSLTTREQVAALGVRLKARSATRNDLNLESYWHALAEESISYVYEILKWRPDTEGAEFEEWKQRLAPHDSGRDYDLLAAFRAGAVPDANGHWPDLFKLPNHPTFSVDSIYAVGVDANHAGRWEGATFIPANRVAD